MTCAEIQIAETAELYLAGQLSPEQQEAYELHYFACEACFHELETRRAVHRALQTSGKVVSIGKRSQWVPWLAATAAALLLAGALWRWSHAVSALPPQTTVAVKLAPPTAPKPVYAVLASFSPPTYDAPVLRSTASDAQARFQSAMAPYRSGNFAAAIPGLRAAAQQDSDAAPHFYLAACLLLTNDVAPAIPELQRVIKSADPRFEEEARLLLAKAYLKQEKRDPARDELKSVIAMRGDFLREAAALLAKVDLIRTESAQ